MSLSNPSDPDVNDKTESRRPLDGIWPLIRILRWLGGFPFNLARDGICLSVSPGFTILMLCIYATHVSSGVGLEMATDFHLKAMYSFNSTLKLTSYTDQLASVGSNAFNMLALVLFVGSQYRSRKSLERLLGLCQGLNYPGKSICFKLVNSREYNGYFSVKFHIFQEKSLLSVQSQSGP